MVIKLNKMQIQFVLIFEADTQRNFNLSQNEIKLYQDLGIVYRNNTSAWECAPLIVHKPRPEKFRLAVDIPPLNTQTIPHVWPISNLETALISLKSTKCYNMIDVCQGYWKISLDKDYPEICSFITPDGEYTPNGVLQGLTIHRETSIAALVACTPILLSTNT